MTAAACLYKAVAQFDIVIVSILSINHKRVSEYTHTHICTYTYKHKSKHTHIHINIQEFIYFLPNAVKICFPKTVCNRLLLVPDEQVPNIAVEDLKVIVV